MFDLYINDEYKETIKSKLIPRLGDAIYYDNKEYIVRKVLLIIEKDYSGYITAYNIGNYKVYVA